MESTNPRWANLQAGRPEQCTTAGERPDRATYTPPTPPPPPILYHERTQTCRSAHAHALSSTLMGNSWAARHNQMSKRSRQIYNVRFFNATNSILAQREGRSLPLSSNFNNFGQGPKYFCIWAAHLGAMYLCMYINKQNCIYTYTNFHG